MSILGYDGLEEEAVKASMHLDSHPDPSGLFIRVVIMRVLFAAPLVRFWPAANKLETEVHPWLGQRVLG